MRQANRDSNATPWRGCSSAWVHAPVGCADRNQEREKEVGPLADLLEQKERNPVVYDLMEKKPASSGRPSGL